MWDASRLIEDILEYHSFLNKNQGPHGRTSIPQIEAIVEGRKEQERRLTEQVMALVSQVRELEKLIGELRFEKAQVEPELHLEPESQEQWTWI